MNTRERQPATERAAPGGSSRRPYRAPELARLGSIADLTLAEGSGPGGLSLSSQQDFEQMLLRAQNGR
jgi:hypothetical protein